MPMTIALNTLGRWPRWAPAVTLTAVLAACAPLSTVAPDAGHAQLRTPHPESTTEMLSRMAPAPGLRLPKPLEAERPHDQAGMASWYGPGLHGRRTASGERFDQYALTAAHPSLPFGTLVCVLSPNNGKSVVVRINDRGPFSKKRIIDLSKGAAQALEMSGLRAVELWRLDDGEDSCPEHLLAQATTPDADAHTP